MNELLEKIYTLLGKAFIQTLTFLLILFIVERLGLYAVHVSMYNTKLIYLYEVGGFFFALILISDVLIDVLEYIIKLYKEDK